MSEHGEEPPTGPQPGGSTAEQPLEDDTEPGRVGEEAGGSGSKESGSRESGSRESPLTLEAAETQVDLPDETQQLQEPQTTEDVGNSTATGNLTQDYYNMSGQKGDTRLKVVLVPEGHVMTVAFAIGLSIQELKCHLASELRVPVDVLHISLDGRAVEEKQSLMELGVRPHGSTRLEMSSTDPTAHPLRPLRPQEHDHMPDVITVQVETSDETLKTVVVEIERPRHQKAFLGGYRHRLTGVEYHSAATQTLPRRRPDRGVVIFSRATQTVELKNRTQQCPSDVTTQTSTIGCYISCMNDKVIVPGKYVTADEYHATRLRAVICLQSYLRRWLSQRAVRQLMRERKQRLAWLETEDRLRKKEKREWMRNRHQCMMNPQRREDFEMLKGAVESWRREEEQKIKSSLQGGEMKAALCSLLEQETQILRDIERKRCDARDQHHDRAIRRLLDKSAEPHQWRAADGGLVSMDTEDTIRSRELRDLYLRVDTTPSSQAERQHVLMELTHTVQKHKSPLTREILDLIKRELHLMSMGTKNKDMEAGRWSLSHLFLKFIKTPEFNPNIAKLLKVPQNPSQLKDDMFRCLSCKRSLRSINFSATVAAGRSRRCYSCSGLDNAARSRIDFSCYRNILQKLRDDEQRLNKDAKIPFLLQVEDVLYLVKVIWHSRSALSGGGDLSDLVLVRWQGEKDWSPWNCILLSKEETSAHLEVHDVHKVYQQPFIERIKLKHILARSHFTQNPAMAEYLCSQVSFSVHGKPAPLKDHNSDVAMTSP